MTSRPGARSFSRFATGTAPWGLAASLIVCIGAGLMMIGEGEPGAITVLSGALAGLFAIIWLVGASARMRTVKPQEAED